MGKSKAKKSETKPEVVQEDATITKAHELKEKGNKHFAKREHVQALACYAQALRVAPEGHPDRALFHSNRAACYLRDQQYDEVVHECNQALEAQPMFGKALLRRARAYELQGDLHRALSDARSLCEESTAEALNEEMRDMVTRLEGQLKSQGKKQRSKAIKQAMQVRAQQTQVQQAAAAAAAAGNAPAAPVRKQVQPLTLKVTLGGDTRVVQVPGTLPFSDLLAVVRRKFPEEQGHLALKYKDKEGNLQPVASRQDLLTAVATAVASAKAPQGLGGGSLGKNTPPPSTSSINLELVRETEGEEVVEFDDWLLDFAELFREQLGISSEAQVDLHQEGLEKCNAALEAAVNSEKAVPLFEQAAAKFQEVAALALLNWGNVHMCQARRLFDSATGASDGKKQEPAVLVSKEARAKAEEHYFKAEEKYKRALAMKEDFYEAVIASGQQLFERAKLLSSTEVTTKEKAGVDKEVESLFEAAQVKLKQALEIVPENAAVEGVVADKKEEDSKGEEAKKGDSKGGEEAKDPPEDVLVRSQVLVMWGNVLYEQSQVRAQQGKEWEALLDDAVFKFREAKCSEDDIAGALSSHAGNKKKEGEKADASGGGEKKSDKEEKKEPTAEKKSDATPTLPEQKKKPKSGKGKK